MNKVIIRAIFTSLITLTANFAFAQKPTTTDDWYKLGKSQFEQNKYEEAIKSFSECVNLNYKAFGCLTYRAYSKEKLGDYKGAINDYSSILLNGSIDRTIYIKRGNLSLKLKDYDAAFKDYSKAIKMNSDEPEGYIARAQLHCLQKNTSAAKSDEQKAIEFGGKIKNPCTADANQNSGNSNQVGNFSTDISKMSMLTLLTKSSAAIKSCQFQEAVDIFTVLIQRYPNDLLNYISRAEAYQYIDISKAKSDLDKASELLKKENLPLGDAYMISTQIGTVKLTLDLAIIFGDNKRALPTTCPTESNQNSGNSTQPVETQPTGNSRQPTEAEIKTSKEKGRTFAKNLDKMILGKSKTEASKIVKSQVSELMKTDFYAGYTALILVEMDDYERLGIWNNSDDDTRAAMNKVRKFTVDMYWHNKDGKPKPLYPSDVPLPGTSWSSNVAASNENQKLVSINQESKTSQPNLYSSKETAETLYKLATQNLEDKKYADAYANAEKISVMPSSSLAIMAEKGSMIYNVAQKLTEANQHEFAKLLIIKYLTLPGTRAKERLSSLYFLGNIYFAEKNYAKAHEYYEQVPDNVDARKNNIDIYIQEKNWKESAALTISTFKKLDQQFLLAANQESKQYWLNLASEFLQNALALANFLESKPDAKADALLVYKAMLGASTSHQPETVKAINAKIKELDIK